MEFRLKFLEIPWGFLRVEKLNAKGPEISRDIRRLFINIVEVLQDVAM